MASGKGIKKVIKKLFAGRKVDQKDHPEEEEKEKEASNNETALLPVLSAWDCVEKYLDGDSIFNISSACSATNKAFQEAEGYSRASMPHILGFQEPEPTFSTSEFHGKPQKVVKMKYSFLVLLMQPIEVNNEYRKLQLHFNFTYPYEDEQDPTFCKVNAGHRWRNMRRFSIEAHRFSSQDKQWEKIDVGPNAPVTLLVKQTLTKCHQELLRREIVLPLCKPLSSHQLVGLMDDYCSETLVLEDFRRREEERRRLREMDERRARRMVCR